MRTTLPLIIFGALFGQANAQVDGIQRCASIADPTGRLACYDTAIPPIDTNSRLTASPRSTAPAVIASAAAGQRDRPDNEASFGLVRDPMAVELRAIESSTVKEHYGWGPNERFVLQNGQVWQIVDNSSASLGRPATSVIIRRGLLGSFYLQFIGWNMSPRVQRIQ